MNEFCRRFVEAYKDEVKKIKVDWLAVSFLGGLFLAAGSCEHIYSGESRFRNEANKCEKTLTQLDPPVYSLKSSSDICIRLDQGVPAQTIIAEFEEQAQRERPWGIAGVLTGATMGLGAGAYMIRAIIRAPRNQREELDESN